jgi:toxin ParE1/3/4
VKKPRLVISEAAAADIVEQADWYQEQSGAELVRRWERPVTSAVLRIVDHPSAGPITKFQASELSNVRRVLIPGFPKHLIFYQVHKSELLILRVVHGARDLETLF